MIINSYIHQAPAGGGSFIFQDDFNDNSFDTAKWQKVAETSGGAITEASQRLELQFSTTGATAHHCRTQNAYDLYDGKTVIINFAAIPANNGKSETVFVQFRDAAGSTTMATIRIISPTTARISHVGNTNFTFSMASHKYIKIETAAGVFSYYGSGDGSSWTLLKTANDLGSSALWAACKISFEATSNASGANTFAIDEFSIANT